MKKDTILAGLVVSLGSILVSAFAVCCVFLIFGISFDGNMKFFLFSFVPAILLLRYYIRNLGLMKVAKTIMVVLFVTLVAFIVFLVRSHEIL